MAGPFLHLMSISEEARDNFEPCDWLTLLMRVISLGQTSYRVQTGIGNVKCEPWLSFLTEIYLFKTQLYRVVR